MSLRILAFTLGLAAGAAAAAPAAESIHLSPLGTSVRGSFILAGKPIPLPEGEFVLAAIAFSDARIVVGDISRPRSRLVSVFLAQTSEKMLRSAVWAATVLELAGPRRMNWIQEPCQKDDTLFRLDLASGASHGEYADQNCLLVDHRVRVLGPSSTGLLKDASAWLAQANVRIPVPLLIVARVTRIDRNQLIQASYFFNPYAFGCESPRSPSWAESPWHPKYIENEPQRPRFVESVTAWGKSVQQHFQKVIAAREPLAIEAPAANSIYRCGASQSMAAPRTPLASP